MPTYSYTHYAPNSQGGLAHYPDGLRTEGPLIPCELRVDSGRASTLTKAGLQVPPAISGKILVDTGASFTCIETTLLTKLGLQPFTTIPITTPTSTEQRGVYACGIAFPGTDLPSIPQLFVVGSNVGAMGFMGLLGRDILARAVLVYSGTSGHWTIAF